MLVRMLNTKVGCDDGLNPATYVEGEVYDLSPVLSRCFIMEGDAEDASEPVAVPVASQADPLPSEPVKPRKNTARKGPSRRKGKTP